MARQWILLTALVCLTLHGSLTGGQGGYSYLDGPSFKVDLAPGSYDGVYDREDALGGFCVSRDLQSNVGEAVSVDPVGGCIGYTLLLRSFDAYGGHCWLVYPLHQAIRFVSCGYCKGHNAYAGYRPCIPEDVPREMWVYCDVLEPGRRIVKTTIPVPVSCKCLAYDC
ncbi:hypothetical protein C0Q70_05864 [Pomacea canaliculata]|uniref:Uncharacterized protein n=1 Tax=Pomacea canaliculata TaxID=400727 RepID=A0A2T7PMC5_POMCA|nr:hypothetical protein C0Q70_05864 [Pomacea canaliculata]